MSGALRTLGCRLLDWHHWPKEATETVTKRSKGGLLAGIVTTGRQVCSACKQDREVYQATGFMLMQSTPWRPLTQKIWITISEHYVAL